MPDTKPSAYDLWLRTHCYYDPHERAVCDPNDPWFNASEANAKGTVEGVINEQIQDAGKPDWKDAVKVSVKTLGSGLLSGLADGVGPGLMTAGKTVAAGLLDVGVDAVVTPALVGSVVPSSEADRRDLNTSWNESEFARKYPAPNMSGDPNAVDPATQTCDGPTSDPGPNASTVDPATQVSQPPDAGGTETPPQQDDSPQASTGDTSQPPTETTQADPTPPQADTE